MSVLSMVSDPQFLALSSGDQQIALKNIDPDFGNLNESDFQSAVTGLQKQALARPDLAAPPAASGAPSTQPMQTSMLGNLISGPSGAPLPSPKAAGTINPSGTSADVATGVLEGGLQTAHTALRGINAATGDSVDSLPTSLAEPDTLKPTNTAQSVGLGAENILEFLSGDEALKGLGLSEKLGLASKVADLAEKSPTIAKALNIGMNSIRLGSVAGAQTLAKGGTGTEAAENAAATGAGGAALETLGAAIPAFLRKSYAALEPEAEKAVGVQQGIADIAKSAGDVTEDVTPTAADPYGLRQVASEQVGRYKEAANLLDDMSEGKFSDAQTAVSDSSDDFTAQGKQAYRQAQQNLDNIVEQYRPDLENKGIDVDGMKDNYRSGMANNKIAAFLDKTTQEVGQGSDALTAQAKSGPQLKDAILDLAQNNKDLLGKAGWTMDHINQAVQFARQMDTANASKTMNVVSQLLQHRLGVGAGSGFLAGASHGYFKQNGSLEDALTEGAEGAATGAALGYASKLAPVVAWKIVSSPLALRIMNSGLATGAASDTVAPYVENEIAKDPSFLQNVKSLLTDESGEMKIPGTGSDTPTHTYDPENGITPTTVSLEDAVDPSKANYIKTRGYIADKVSGTSADAGDLTQNVMTKLVKNYDNISNKSPQGIGSYLQHAADNEVNDYMRLNPLKRDLGLTEVPPAEGSIGKLPNGRPEYGKNIAQPLPEPGTEGDVPKSDAASDDSTNFNYVKAYQDYLSDHPEDRELLEEIANKTPTNTEGTLVNVNRADLERAPYEPTFGLTKTDVADLNRQFKMGGPENVKAKLSQIASDIESYIPRKSVPSSVINTFYPGKDYSPTGSYTFPDSLNTESPMGQEGIRYMVDFEDGRGPVSLGTYRTGPTVTSKPFGHGESSPPDTPANSLRKALQQARGTLK